MRTITKVKDIQPGDRFEHGIGGTGWVALDNAVTDHQGVTTVRVQYEPDGGVGHRTWDDCDHEIGVIR